MLDRRLTEGCMGPTQKAATLEFDHLVSTHSGPLRWSPGADRLTVNCVETHALRWAKEEGDLTLLSRCWLGQACVAENRLDLGFRRTGVAGLEWLICCGYFSDRSVLLLPASCFWVKSCKRGFLARWTG